MRKTLKVKEHLHHRTRSESIFLVTYFLLSLQLLHPTFSFIVSSHSVSISLERSSYHHPLSIFVIFMHRMYSQKSVCILVSPFSISFGLTISNNKNAREEEARVNA